MVFSYNIHVCIILYYQKVQCRCTYSRVNRHAANIHVLVVVAYVHIHTIVIDIHEQNILTIASDSVGVVLAYTCMHHNYMQLSNCVLIDFAMVSTCMVSSSMLLVSMISACKLINLHMHMYVYM